MWLGRDTVIAFLIPETTVRVFLPAWTVSAISQPISALAFLTDGVHWGTGDYRYLRNAMIVAAIVGFGGVWLLELVGVSSLFWVWIVVGIWVVVRATLGILRIWPGIGKSAFREDETKSSF
jgi:MATE family multidrug resistance protein